MTTTKAIARLRNLQGQIYNTPDGKNSNVFGEIADCFETVRAKARNLADAAANRENVMGDPCSLFNAKSALAEAEKELRAKL